MLPDELTAFLDLYAHPAAIVADGAVHYENAHFRHLRLARGELLLAPLRAAATPASTRLVTPFPLQTPGATKTVIRWSLTQQVVSVPMAKVTQLRTVFIAQDSLPLEDDGSLSAFSNPELPLLGRDNWFDHPRYEGLRTGGEEMGDIIRSWDWASTPLGHMSTWNQTLINSVSILIKSPFPMCIYWGPHHAIVYNNAYKIILAPEKHDTRVLGRPFTEAWGETYKEILPLLAAPQAGQSASFRDQLLFIQRQTETGQRLEEAYMSWSLLPLYEPDGTVGGQLHSVFEETRKVINDRRMHALRELARLSSTRTLPALWTVARDVLDQLAVDFPHAVAYSLHNVPGSPPVPGAPSVLRRGGERRTFVLQETIGCRKGCAMAPLCVTVEGKEGEEVVNDGPWPIAQVCRTREIVVVEDIGHLLVDVPERGIPGMRPTRAAVLPLLRGDAVVGCLVVCLNPALPYDMDFQKFLEVLSRQISASAVVMWSYESEVHKNEDWTALDKAKTAFFTNISHELRTPLTLILGPAAELRDTSLSKTQQAQVTMIDRNAKRLLRLVNSILDFAAAEAGRLTPRFQPTRIGSYVEDLASAFRGAIEAAGLEYTVTSSLPAEMLLWIDRDKFEKMFYNLVGNALKFTTEGFIRIDMEVESEYFVLAVADSGIGIPRAEFGSVFEKFHRSDNTSSRSIEGTGIGLPLTLELAKFHKGTVRLESVVGQGSTFRLVLPLGSGHLPSTSIMDDNAQTHTPSDDSTTAIDEASRWGSSASTGTDASVESIQPSDVFWQPLPFGDIQRARVLVVDDNADMRRYISSLLGKFCDLQEVSNGRAALEELRTQRYNLVLSDYLMPQMNGAELLAAIRADGALKNIPFIMLSARAGEEARLEGLALGVDDYLAKPFSGKELLLRSHTQLQAASMRDELEARMEDRTRALEHSRASFKRLSERLSVGVHRADAEGKITWANQRWIDTLDLDPHSVNDWSHKIHSNDRERAVDAYREAITHRKGYEQPVEMQLVDGDNFIDIIYDLQPEFAPDSTKGDKFLGWVGVFSDVSNLRRLERANIETERARAQEADKNRVLHERFLDITCHELRNPLNAIYNSAELVGESLVNVQSLLRTLRERATEPRSILALPDILQPEWDAMESELQEDLDGVKTIILCAKHQKRIADVLNVSKLSANLVTLTMSDFRPFDELSSIIRMFRDEGSARGIHLELIKDESWDRLGVDSVVGDPGRFTQIVVNILSNAIKFTESAARHDVRVCIGAAPVPLDGARDDSSSVLAGGVHELLPNLHQTREGADLPALRLFIAVADSGHGMTNDEQQRIFQRFAQASPRTYGEFGGSGLGLYISRNLAHLHGGKIHLQSEKDVGTIVRFFIAVERSSAWAPAAARQSPRIWSLPMTPPADIQFESRPALAAPSQPFRILVVEDNLINQKLLVKLLANLSCSTAVASDGQDCVNLLLQLARAEPPEPYFDLILMDLEMPVLGGMEATKLIRKLEAEQSLPKSVPIVAVSGNARSEHAERAAIVGMNGFIRKPYSKAELNELIVALRTGQIQVDTFPI